MAFSRKADHQYICHLSTPYSFKFYVYLNDNINTEKGKDVHLINIKWVQYSHFLIISYEAPAAKQADTVRRL